MNLRASLIVVCALSAPLAGQQAPASPASHVTIPFLANATRPADLDFEGGECDVDAAGTTLDCQFQQVLLTTTPLAAQTCMVTTNRYERAFKKDAPGRWISTEGPDGICGVLDVHTLRDEGGVRWTLEMRKQVMRKDAAPECRQIDEQPEILSWQNVRRPLPCTFVQPGGLR